MKRCCFCFNLKRGTIAGAVFVLITRSLAFILYSTILVLHQKHLSQNEYEHLCIEYQRYGGFLFGPWYTHVIPHSNVWFITAIIISCFQSLSSIILLIGVKEKSRILFLPWIVLFGMEIFLGLVFVITILAAFSWIFARRRLQNSQPLEFHQDQTFLMYIAMTMSISIQCYILVCVIYYCKQMSTGDKSIVYSIVPSDCPNTNKLTNTATPFYKSAGLYHCSLSSSDQPRKYECMNSPCSANASPNEKPPY